MEAMAFAERFSMRRAWHARAGFTANLRNPFVLCLCLSLSLHGLLLLMPMAARIPLGEAHVSTPLPALKLRLHMKTVRVESASHMAMPLVANVPVPKGHVVRATPARSTIAIQKDVVVPPEPVQSAAPSFNLEELRAQARNLTRNPPDQLVRGVGTNRNTAPAVAQDSLDRPILEALSRRLGKNMVVASEQIMADGSRMIRFAGNTCLHIPQHLPDWQISTMGPTILVPTNCL